MLRPVIRGARTIDRAMGRIGQRRTVLVEARTPMNLAVLAPVFAPLLLDPRLTVRFTAANRDALADAVEGLGIADRVIDRRTAAWTRVDLYMNADPWDALTLHRVDKQVNFFHGVAGKYNLECPTDLPLDFARYDRVAFPNAGRRDAYVAAGIVPAERAALIGFPKTDVLVTERDHASQRAADLGFDDARPTAIFAPTFSPASALHAHGEAIIETLLASGCNVIAKLHDRSLDPDPRYSGGVDWRARLARFSGPHFLLATDGDSTRYVLASQLMVTDHSSIGFEFCVLDRPVIVFDMPGLIEAARISEKRVDLLRSAATVVSNTTELAAAVRDALAAPDARSPQRLRAAAEVFHQPGGATARALALLYDLLQLPPLATVTEQPSAFRLTAPAKATARRGIPAP
jgi:hypothetical protein